MDFKSLSNPELYAAAYPLSGEPYSDIIAELLKRSSYEDVEYSITQSQSNDDAIREIAIDTLAQIRFDRDLSERELEQIQFAICENLHSNNESLLESSIMAQATDTSSKQLIYMGNFKTMKIVAFDLR